MSRDKDKSSRIDNQREQLNWRPVAELDTLRLRAQVFTRIRAFFQDRAVMEVDSPALVRRPVSDPNIESLSVEFISPQGEPQKLYLATSPEYYMKRLLAAGIGSIYQLSHVFRQGELGPAHEPEFMMLEWYRLDFSLPQLMQEVHELVRHITEDRFAISDPGFLTYQQAFQTHLNIDPLAADTEMLVDLATQQGLALREGDPDRRETCLDFLFSHCIQPQLGFEGPCFLTDYPAEQAALARVSEEDPRVAERFELFINGLELANGFRELADVDEQRRRFEQDLAVRHRRKQMLPAIDEMFLAALSAGIPDCSGVAVGVDRLIQLMIEQKKLKEVLAFPFFHD